ncbi:transposase [Trichoderma arundinaceum]|uniref:Transposase n=1 Tax=Trichoderma arundinaceum TaxID=490622 RepID=A0A395N9X2_TRIAR|nr:transposase [Trichoderma arundinaceum]
MAPNLALSQQYLIDNAIISKLGGGDAPTDENLARISSSTARTVRRRRSNQVRFGTTKAPSNGVGRPRTITPNMLAALCDKLVDSPCMRLKDMVAFLRKEFGADVTRFSILPAYTQDGIIYFGIFEGSTDGEKFEEFLERLLPYCGKWPEPRSVLIIDNASIHHSERVQQLCEDAGVVLLYLPPYSPDLNPIEEFFGELKRYIQEVWDEFEELVKDDFAAFLAEAVRVVGKRKESARGHFEHAGISIEKTLNSKYF